MLRFRVNLTFRLHRVADALCLHRIAKFRALHVTQALKLRVTQVLYATLRGSMPRGVLLCYSWWASDNVPRVSGPARQISVWGHALRLRAGSPHLPTPPSPPRSGWYCPVGSTAWNGYSCGRGNYCPAGSAAPTSCGTRNTPGDLGLRNGPAYYVDTAACAGHCYNGGPGQLSTCA